MKKTITLLAVIFLPALLAEAQNTERNKGLGAMLGDPTGVSLSYWTSNSNAFSAGAAWHFVNNPSMHLHVDYLFYRFDIIQPNQGALPLYFGVGGRIRFDNEDTFGVRFPLGIAYHFQNDPLELFLEIVPVLDLVPGTGVNGNSSIGIQYYF